MYGIVIAKLIFPQFRSELHIWLDPKLVDAPVVLFPYLIPAVVGVDVHDTLASIAPEVRQQGM